MDRNSILAAFDALNVWSRGDRRAPHKPLLVLYALGWWSRGQCGDISFRELDPELRTLLREFGLPRQSYHPEYPFWRLQNDGVWEVEATGPLKPRKGNTDPPKGELVAHDARGHFSAAIQAALQADPALVTDIAARLLDGQEDGDEGAEHGRSAQGYGFMAAHTRLPQPPTGASHYFARSRSRAFASTTRADSSPRAAASIACRYDLRSRYSRGSCPCWIICCSRRSPPTRSSAAHGAVHPRHLFSRRQYGWFSSPFVPVTSQAVAVATSPTDQPARWRRSRD
jgi:hypothetical protein